MLVVSCKEEENLKRKIVPQHYADVHRAAVFALPEAVEGLVRQRDPAEVRVMEEQVRGSRSPRAGGERRSLHQGHFCELSCQFCLTRRLVHEVSHSNMHFRTEGSERQNSLEQMNRIKEIDVFICSLRYALRASSRQF